MPNYIIREQYDQMADTKVHDDPLLDWLYRGRGVTEADELDYGLAGIESPYTLKGIEQAAALLADSIEKGERLLIISDYDCDGATGCAIGVEGLQGLGASNVEFLVPNRFDYGYGLSPEIVAEAAKLKPDVIITVDNGIASVAGAQAVKDLAHPTKLLITDHHLAPEQMPEADVIVNPNQPGCEFPSKALAGCGVMFYVLLATRKELKARGWFETHTNPNMADLLDLLALGTVADVVPLDHNNRILVRQGLDRINQGYVRPGIRALLEIGNRTIGNIVASDFGFVAGPRLNAAGRLEDMTIGINCLLEKDPGVAMQYATRLDEINRERKVIEQDMKDSAVENIELAKDRYGLCVYRQEWHQGVIGIVASRIKDSMFRPVICFAPDSNGIIKGSARSVKGFHMRDALANIDAKAPGILLKYGGHAMAAGMSIKYDDYERFCDLFDEQVKLVLTAKDIEGNIETDGVLPKDRFDIYTAQLLKDAGPWGQHFPEPVFMGEFTVIEHRVLADKHLKMLLHPIGGSQPVEAICFNCVDGSYEFEWPVINAVFKLDVNEWRGRQSLQLLIDHFTVEGIEQAA